MKNKLVIMAVIIASITLTAGIVRAASITVDSLTVGKQGVGGVTFFNGTIINNTTTSGADNPVTFGDNVRIDGSVYRGATAGSGDNNPFKINDDSEVVGNLTVDKGLTVNSSSTILGDLNVGGNSADLLTRGQSDNLRVYGVIYSGTVSGPQTDGFPVVVDDHLSINGSAFVDGYLSVDGNTTTSHISGGEAFFTYVNLGETNSQPSASDCSTSRSSSTDIGCMKFDPDNNKLWICGYSGRKSFSAD